MHFARSILLIARTDKAARSTRLTSSRSGRNCRPWTSAASTPSAAARSTTCNYFTDCFLPDSAVVGQVGNGWNQLMAGLNTERLILAAMQLGLAERSFAQTLQFITERKQFGRPIGTFQALRHRMADLATEIECTKLLVYSVAQKADDNPDKLLPARRRW